MAELRLERDYNIAADELFEMISTQAGLLQWWGPETMTVPEHNLDFTREGPWFSVMVNPEGGRYKVSGQVTHVRAGNSVGFTWAWHDENDARGEESHVTLKVEALNNAQSRLVLHHTDLPHQEAADNHNTGWSSSLNKLNAALSA